MSSNCEEKVNVDNCLVVDSSVQAGGAGGHLPESMCVVLAMFPAWSCHLPSPACFTIISTNMFNWTSF